MRENIGVKNSIENINSVNRYRENLSILKWIDGSNFDKLVKSFWSEKEQNKILLSWFLNSTNVTLAQLWEMKIDIDHIKNYIQNKPDIPKDLEIKIAKLYLEKLYQSWCTNLPFIMDIKWAFNIENKADIENKNIDFKTIQVNIQNLTNDWSENINSVTISNDEIFDLIKHDVNKYTTFESQNVSSQPIILDILQFEVKWVIDYIKTWWQNVETSMKDTILPTSNISEMFDEVHDQTVQNLTIQKWKLEEFLFMWEDRLKATEKTELKEKINDLKSAWFDDDRISKIKKLLLWKIEYSQVKSFLTREINIINKKIWRKYIENFKKSEKNKDIVAILRKLYSNEFDFSKLERKEQTILWQSLVVSKFDNKDNPWAKYTWLNQDEFKLFLNDLYNFEKDEITIDIDWVGTLNLHVTKEVNSGENGTFVDPDKFKNMDAINPIKFTVNIDNNDENMIKDLETTKDSPLRVNWIMETHITKWWEINIWNWYILEICGKRITKSQLDELLNCDSDTDSLNEKLKEFGLYDELKDFVAFVKKWMYNPQNIYDNMDENWFDDSSRSDGWYWPYWYRFCVFEEVLKNLDVNVVERNLIFEWNDVDKLSQIYLMSKFWWWKLKEQQDKYANSSLDADRDPEELGDADAGKARATAVWNSLKYDYNENSFLDEDTWEIEYQRDEWIDEKAQEYRDKLTPEWKIAFKDTLRDLCENNSDSEEEKGILDNVIEDIIDTLESSRYNVEINDNKKDIPVEPEKSESEKFKESWNKLQWDKECESPTVWTRLYFDLWESQLPPKDLTDATKSFYCFEIVNIDNNIDNPTFTLKAIWWDLKSSLVDKEFTLPMTSEQLESMKQWKSIYRVRPGKSRSWDDCLGSINNAWFFKKFTAFGNMEWQVKLDWNKFVNEKGEEVKYFDRVEWIFDNGKTEIKDWWQWDKLYKYEIKKIDTTKWTVKIASNFDSYDDNYKEVRYEYENEISFEQFILLMEWKKLKWYTENEQKEIETKYSINDPKRLATKWRRRRISIWSIINVFKNTTKAIKWKIEENRKEQDEVLENYLFSQEWLDLYWKSRRLLWDVAEKMQYEFYTNRENRTRKKIEERYKIFESDPQYSEFFFDHLKNILAKSWYVWNDKDRYKFAAAFLVMVKKEWPYPRDFANQKDKWKRVENLLWPEHKTRFLNFYNKKKNELEQEKDMWHQSWARLALQEELNKMEIQYIISTIDGRAPYGPASNEYMLKSIWSKNFMSKLEENINWYYNNHQAEKDKLETFYAAEESYLRNVWSGKFQAALPALERMCEVCKTPWEVFRIKWYILGAMLMWIIKNNSTAKTIKSFWWTCRSMWFAPWYWMRDPDHQDKVQALLDWITNNQFSKDTNYNNLDFMPGNIKDWKYSFSKKFQWYWNSHGEKILKKLEDPPYKDKNINGDKSIIDLANENENPNNYIFKDIINNSTTNDIDSRNDNVAPIFAQESPLTATSNMIMEYIPRSGSYQPKNPEDISTIEDFWKKVNLRIPSWPSDKETTWFLFKKYFNRFDRSLTSNEEQMIVKSLGTIQKEKAAWHEVEAKFMLWYMIKWNLHSKTSWSFPEDFENVVNKFVDFFFDNIWYIDQSLVKETFTDKEIYSVYDKPYRMLNWSDYLEYNMTDTKWIYSSSKSNYNNSMSYYLNTNDISEDDIINKKIAEIWRSIHNKCSVPEKLKWSTAGESFQILTNQELKKLKEQNLSNLDNEEYAIPA